MVSMATALKRYREELFLTQKELAEEIGMPYKTYKNVEEGRQTRYTTAKRILNALNQIRVACGMSPVTLEDIGLNIV